MQMIRSFHSSKSRWQYPLTLFVPSKIAPELWMPMTEKTA
jgi:hypothetical protein